MGVYRALTQWNRRIRRSRDARRQAQILKSTSITQFSLNSLQSLIESDRTFVISAVEKPPLYSLLAGAFGQMPGTGL